MEPIEKRIKPTPAMSYRGRDGTVIETVHRREEGKTEFAVRHNESLTYKDSVTVDGQTLVPYSSANNLLTHRVVLLASSMDSVEDNESLIHKVREFLHRYVDLSPLFEEVAAHYVLLTWLYDEFNELPYLRVRGEYGSGKSRFLLTVGSLCYKPIFASGASTISPIFRLIDEVGGTLVIDEADFFASDERAEVVKILNNGNARGFPVLRNDITPTKEFNPRAFDIFGPKIVATRHRFQDEALESRCLTDVLGDRVLRSDIPVSLPKQFHAEAEALRNKLLSFRFENVGKDIEIPVVKAAGVSARRAQILAPLLAVALDEEAKSRLIGFVQGSATTSPQSEVARRVLSATKAVIEADEALSLAVIAERFSTAWGEHYGSAISHRWIGGVLRRLGLSLHKTNGVYAIPLAELPRLKQLVEEHGLGDVRDKRDQEPLVA